MILCYKELKLKIKNLILAEYERHPEAALVDYYKMFFQGTFGPAHLLSNKEKAFAYLKNEVENNTEYEDFFWQDVSYFNRFFRINLRIVKENIISAEEFFQLFSESTKLKKKISANEWKREWGKILNLILELKLPLKNLEPDMELLANAFRENKYLFRHSKIYNRIYHPHYRIIGEKQFKKIAKII